MKRKTNLGLQYVAIIIVDPSIKEGFPLWSGYRSFSSTPNMKEATVDDTPRNSAFEEMIHWVTMTIAKSPGKVQPKILAAPILSIVAAEWLTVLQYCTTRAHQVELDLQSHKPGSASLGLETSL